MVNALFAEMPDTRVIHFDDYEVEMPSDLSAWLAAGADFDEWHVPKLVWDLEKARVGRAPVLFEAPLGRAHDATGRSIDFLVFVDVPLEIALARFVSRELNKGGSRLDEYLAMYEPLLHGIYLQQVTQVKRGADLVVDGTRSVDAVVRQILEVLR